MTETVAMRNIKTKPENDTGTAILKLVNVEVKVSANGKNVDVSTNDGFQLVKRPAAAAPEKGIHTSADHKKVDLHGVTVEQAADGHLIISGENIECQGKSGASDKLQVGQLTSEGIFFGYSTDENGATRAWFADLDDAKDREGKRLSANFNERAAYAQKRNQENHLGHNDWIVAPTWHGKKGEFDALRALFDARAKVGGFKAGEKYGSSTRVYAEFSEFTQTVDFRTGRRNSVDETTGSPFRLVRSVAI